MILAVLTAWPLVYFFVFVGFLVVTVAGGLGDAEPDGMRALFALHIATMLIIIGLLIFYVVHAYRSPRVPEDRRVLWTILLLFGSMVAMPIYFWLYIRPADAQNPRSVTGFQPSG